MIWHLVVVVSFAAMWYSIYTFTLPQPLPQLHLKYWGPDSEKPDDPGIRPFLVKFSESDIIKLKYKLNRTTIPLAPKEFREFKFDSIMDYMNDELIKFWTTEYNWTEREAYMNQFPQFITEIGGLDLHFVHVKPNPSQSKGKDVLPLLVIHGWPSIPSEFYELASLLTTPHPDVNFMFEIVIPSLPGFAFSEGPYKAGLNAAERSLILDELMKRLGFTSYYIHGSGWGSIIGSALAILRPNRVLGLHSTLCLPFTLKSIFYTGLSLFFPSIFVEEPMREYFVKQWSLLDNELGPFYRLEARFPVTFGIRFRETPVLFSAYVLDKMLSPENRYAKFLEDGGFENLNKTKFLDNINVILLTKTVITSLRIYSENTYLRYFSMGIHEYFY